MGLSAPATGMSRLPPNIQKPASCSLVAQMRAFLYPPEGEEQMIPDADYECSVKYRDECIQAVLVYARAAETALLNAGIVPTRRELLHLALAATPMPDWLDDLLFDTAEDELLPRW